MYGCHIKTGETWVHITCATESELDALISLFEAAGLEVA